MVDVVGVDGGGFVGGKLFGVATTERVVEGGLSAKGKAAVSGGEGAVGGQIF